MNRFLVLGGLALVVWIGELSLKYFPFATVRWDGIALIVLYLGLSVPIRFGGPAVFVLGWVQEALGASLHGPILFSFLVVYFFLRVSRDHLFFEGSAAIALWVFLLTLLQKGVQGGLLVWVGFPFVPGPWGLLGTAFLQAAASLVFFPFLEKIGGREGR